MSERWMNIEEVASYLGVTAYDVQAWIDVYELPARLEAQTWRFDRPEIDAWLDRLVGRMPARRCLS